jgi:hypothetical protein
VDEVRFLVVVFLLCGELPIKSSILSEQSIGILVKIKRKMK